MSVLAIDTRDAHRTAGRKTFDGKYSLLFKQTLLGKPPHVNP